MNYVKVVREALKDRIDDYDNWGEDASRLLDLYALLVLTKGTQTTMEDIHDSWSLWTNAFRPDHKSLVPFNLLSVRVAEYDRPYFAAVMEVARMLGLARYYALEDCREDAVVCNVNRSQQAFEDTVVRRFETLAARRGPSGGREEE